MSFAFQIPVSCRVACLAIVSLAFISVVLLLSTVTNDPKYLNLFTLSHTQDGFIHIAASGWISVNTEEKKNKHYIQKVKNQ